MPASRIARTALIVVSPSINYFYSVIGHRLSDALRHLGYECLVTTLQDAPEHAYDWLFLVNISEITAGYGTEQEALKRISRLKAGARQVAMVLLECVNTKWFAENYRLCKEAGIEFLLDLGFHDQYEQTPPKMRDIYHFLFSGLSQVERLAVRQLLSAASQRPIPWTFIGHMEVKRGQFVLELLKSGLEKNGIVYLPTLTHVAVNGPHINGQQLQMILEKTRYYIWCAHHDYFYLESERFRNAVMAGSVPIKVMNTPVDHGLALPFSYLLLDEHNFVEQIQSFDFVAVQERFMTEYCDLPSLEQSLSSILSLGN